VTELLDEVLPEATALSFPSPLHLKCLVLLTLWAGVKHGPLPSKYTAKEKKHLRHDTSGIGNVLVYPRPQVEGAT
jgi:hypothetical protein